MAAYQRSGQCKEIFALLSDYLNLELPAEACQEIETHLSGCAPCVEFVESLRKTIELCRRYRRPNCPRRWDRARARNSWRPITRCSPLAKPKRASRL